MPSPYRIRSREEKRLEDAANRILDDPNSTPADRLKACGFLERLIRLKERRRQEREELVWVDDAPAAPKPAESVDDLVRSIEAKKPPLIPKDLAPVENALEPITAPIAPAKAPEVTPNAQAAQTGFCAFCQAAGDWNTRWPIDKPEVLLCPTCFSKMCSAEAMKAAAKAAAPPPDWDETFAEQRGMYKADYQRSVEIWHDQDRQAAQDRADEQVERTYLEAELNQNRAKWIQNGGKL